jgi:hypothetical protein
MRMTTIIPTKNSDTDTDPAIMPMELLAEVERTEGMLEGVTAVELAGVERVGKFEVADGCSQVTSSLLGSHVREGREHVATVSPTRTRWVSQE